MRSITSLSVILALAIVPAGADDLSERIAASRATVQKFMGALMGELQAAMKKGGPVEAIAICNTRAPAIAEDASRQNGWTVGRTSLKLRSPRNAPDAWEEEVLKKFEARKAAGEDPATLEYSEVVTRSGKSQFRYMKAIVIPRDAPCLACHGTAIAPDVAAKLKALYPEDRATGYKTGDLRGAFTITQPM